MTRVEAALSSIPSEYSLALLDQQMTRQCEWLLATLQDPTATREEKRVAHNWLGFTGLVAQPIHPDYPEEAPSFDLVRDRLTDFVEEDQERRGFLFGLAYFTASQRTLKKLRDLCLAPVRSKDAYLDPYVFAAGVATDMIKPRFEAWYDSTLYGGALGPSDKPSGRG